MEYTVLQKRIKLAKRVQRIAAERQRLAAAIAVGPNPVKANEKLQALFQQVRDGAAIVRQNPGAQVRLPRPIELHRARCELRSARSSHAKLMQRMENLSNDINAARQELADFEQEMSTRADSALQQIPPENQ